MSGWKERRLVYAALLIACCVLGAAAGPVAGVWSFVQVAAIIELTCRLGTGRNEHWKYRRS